MVVALHAWYMPMHDIMKSLTHAFFSGDKTIACMPIQEKNTFCLVVGNTFHLPSNVTPSFGIFRVMLASLKLMDCSGPTIAFLFKYSFFTF